MELTWHLRRTWEAWRYRAPLFLAVSIVITLLGAVTSMLTYRAMVTVTAIGTLVGAGTVWRYLGAVRRRRRRPEIELPYLPGPGWGDLYAGDGYGFATDVLLAARDVRRAGGSVRTPSETTWGIACVAVGTILVTLSFPITIIWFIPPPNVSAGSHAFVLFLSVGLGLAFWPSQSDSLRRAIDRLTYAGLIIIPNTLVDYALKAFGVN